MQRISYIDIIKGLLMFSVIYSHCNLSMHLLCDTENTINCFIFEPFNMPLFMAISGYFFYYSAKKRDIADLLKSKLLSILIPCVAWAVLCDLVTSIIFTAPHAPTWRCLYPFNNLWFLWSVCLCFCLCIIPDRLHRRNRHMGHGAAAAICIVLYLLPGRTYSIAYMFPFFYAGYVTCMYDLNKRIKPWHIIGCCVLTVIFWICFKHGHFSGFSVWHSGTYLWGPMGVKRHLLLNVFRLTIGVTGSIGFAGMMWYAYKWFKGRSLSSHAIVLAVKETIMQMGVYSLSLYAVQSIIVETCFWRLMRSMQYRGYLDGLIPCHALTYKYVYVLGAAIVMSITCLIAIRLIARVKPLKKILLGK